MSKPKYPIDKYLGMYEGYTIRLYNARRLEFVDAFMMRFLKYFPRVKGWEEFTISDMNDYRIWRIRQGCCPKTVDIELGVVKNFFVWLIEECEAPLHNPLASKTYTRPESKNRLGLEGLKRLLLASDDLLRGWILAEVIGEECTNRLRGGALHVSLRNAAKKAGLDWLYNVAIFRKSILGVWRDLVMLEGKEWKKKFLPPIDGSDLWEWCT